MNRRAEGLNTLVTIASCCEGPTTLLVPFLMVNCGDGIINSMSERLPIMAGKYESDTYAEQKADDYLKSKDVKLDAIVRTEDSRHCARPNLFGTPVGTVLTINDKESAERVLKTVTHNVEMTDQKIPKPKTSDDEKKLITNLRNMTNNGMFIIKAMPNSKAIKTLISIVDKYGEGFDDPSKDRMGEAGRILQDCSLSRDVKDQLLDYLGESYDILLPVVKNISALDEDEQKSMTIDEVMLRVPNPPGKVLPWSSGFGPESRKALDYTAMNGDARGALERLDRVLEGGVLPIMFSGWFMNTVHRSIMMWTMIENGGDPDKAAHALGYGGMNYTKSHLDPYNNKGGWPVKIAYERARNAVRKGATSGTLLDLDSELADDYSIIKGQTTGRKMKPETAVTDMVIKTCIVYSGHELNKDRR